MKARVERGEHDLRVRAVRRADDDGVEAACIEHRAVVRVNAPDSIAGRKRFAHGEARLRERGDREAVAERREVRKVLCLGDQTAADDADADRQARITRATFSNENAISSRSCSSQSGETSMWTDRSSSASVRGQSGAGRPASASASKIGRQNG